MDKDPANAGDDSPELIVNELRMTFKEEAYELLAELEHALLELEKAPHDKEQIGRVFRAVHTMKGSGGACEFHDIVAFTHELETILDHLRSGRVAVTKEIINLTLLARDQLKSLFNRYYHGETADDAKSAKILASFKKQLQASTDHDRATPGVDKSIKSKESHPGGMTYRIRFRPHINILSFAINPLHLLKKLHELGTCNVIAHTDSIPHLENLDPSASYVYWDIILTTSRGMNAIHDVFVLIKDKCELKIEVIDEEAYLDDEKTYKNIGEILLDRGDLAPDDLEKVLKVKKRVGEMLIETGAVSGTKVESALIEQQHVREVRQHRLADSSASIRVSTGKLDNLVNLVGELVTVQARLNQTALSTEIPALLSVAEEIERLTESLRECAMNIRMLPIGTTFNKFQRLVRDLSVELGKEIEMTTDGAETELDKTVIEQLGDPLVHIIRNSIGHGIERPDVREAAGKPRKGNIHLSALHSGAHVLIQVNDDGAGIDQNAVRAKAVEKGLIVPDAVLTEREIFSFLFAPGFTTAEKVTDVSGRGVGLDVVKKTIETLRGSIEMSSQRGKGTVIILKLPLTLAIIDGLLVTIQERFYVLPMSFVKECVELTVADKNNSHGRQIANVRGELVPYINLRNYFLIEGEPPANEEQIVITETDGRRVGFVVDTVVGGHQTVIKNLGAFYQNVEGISGATILGDGTVALILNVPRLVRCAEREEVAMHQGGGRTGDQKSTKIAYS
jgi:two-component system chemotaxis sensor kinase CheA